MIHSFQDTQFCLINKGFIYLLLFNLDPSAKTENSV